MATMALTAVGVRVSVNNVNAIEWTRTSTGIVRFGTGGDDAALVLLVDSAARRAAGRGTG
jgi:hypothetical protein